MRARRLANLAVVIISVLATVAAVEGLARAMEWIDPPPPRSPREFRLTLPPPYRDAPYDVRTILDESAAVGWTTDRRYGWLPTDYTGRYINVRERRRVTTDQPAVARRIWLFGGSTMISTEVPDNLTPASILQRRLNQAGIAIRVENRGASSLTTHHELYQLTEMTTLSAGDIVVFYDGVNDITQTLFYGNPDGTMVEENRRRLYEQPWYTRFILRLHHSMASRSAFVRLFLNPTQPLDNQPPFDPALAQRLADDYTANIRRADEFVRARGGTFVHVLQPNIASLARRTSYEDSLIADPWTTPPKLMQALTLGVPTLRQAVTRLRQAGIDSHDATAIFDARSSEIMLDFCHVNHVGNELIAAAIFAVLPPAALRR